MSATQTAKSIAMGLRTIYTQKFDPSSNTYTGTFKKWQGHTELDIKFSQNEELLPSGDDPAWDVARGAVVAELTLKFYDIPLSEWSELFNVISNGNGVLIGEDGVDETWLGVFGDTMLKDGSFNRTVLFKCRFDLPDLNHITIKEDDNSVQELELSGKAYPVFYDKSDGTQGRRTCQIMNSATNSTAFSAYDSGFVIPKESDATAA